jgi:uncharacterized protein
LIDEIFVIDGVLHVPDLSTDNVRKDRPDALAVRDAFVATTSAGMGHFGSLSPPRTGKRYSVEETYDTMFVKSPTDMAMVQVAPIFDWFTEWFAPIQLNHAFAAAHPDRVLFCGGADPSFRGLKDALALIEYQVRELGARSMKFYNGHVNGASWRCDDEAVAYPLYEKCREVGLKVIQFHKSVPIGLQNVEDLRPNDLQAPARDFPDLTFVVHHPARTYFDELVSIASRFPNVYLLLSPFFSYGLVAPRLIQEQLGLLLQTVGSDKLLYGSDGPINGLAGPSIEAFLKLEIPQDLREGYGYPQITRTDRERILGLNFARLFDIDVEAKKLEFSALPKGTQA